MQPKKTVIHTRPSVPSHRIRTWYLGKVTQKGWWCFAWGFCLEVVLFYLFSPHFTIGCTTAYTVSSISGEILELHSFQTLRYSCPIRTQLREKQRWQIEMTQLFEECVSDLQINVFANKLPEFYKHATSHSESKAVLSPHWSRWLRARYMTCFLQERGRNR